jgi:flavin-dependent dehydrogenase
MKIAIIGAGINGLYLAWKLAERGEEVIVFEKREKIGKEACSGLFSERILEFIPPSEIQKLIQNQINSTLIHFPGRTFKIRFSRKFFVMDHFKLDNLVAELAQKAGVKIILNNPINFLPAGFDRIIGCDGAVSLVRKILGLKEPNYRLAIQGVISKRDYSDFVETWPVDQGFIWKIPRGKETEYGIIASPKEAKKVFQDFLAKNKIFIEKISSALVPRGFLVHLNNRITLCGDAVGLTKPWSGGGVIWGLIAADLLLKNFPDFLKYQKEIKKFFLPKIIFSKIVVKMVYFFGFNIPWLIPKNVKIKGDFLI